MATERDNSGILFRNDKKTSEKHPDYKGNAIIGTKKMWLSAWIKEGARGKFMSLAFTPADQQAQPQTKTPAQDEEFEPPF